MPIRELLAYLRSRKPLGRHGVDGDELAAHDDVQRGGGRVGPGDPPDPQRAALPRAAAALGRALVAMLERGC